MSERPAAVRSPPIAERAPGGKTDDPWWVTPSLIVLAACIFLVALGMAYFANDKSLLNVMCGAAIAIAQGAFNWRFGSSKGSQDKDATMAAAAGALATSFPAAPATPATLGLVVEPGTVIIPDRTA